jgi:hypothetical protein
MKLHHGCNQAIVRPEILYSKRQLDFGYGFYTTSNLVQASRCATLKAKRVSQNSSPVVSVYDFDKVISTILIKEFKKADEAWLDFIVKNRASGNSHL